jgi:hypothetical protein
MRAELYRPDEPDRAVAIAAWDGTSASIEAGEGAPDGIDRLLRPTPVVVDDPALRRQGTHGETLLEPGTLEWFRWALLTRAGALGLAVRFVPGVQEGGWDPAAQYSSFEERIERLTSSEA